MSLRVSRYSTNYSGYTFAEWCDLAGALRRPGGHYMDIKYAGPKERAAWKADEDPADWDQANRRIEEARRLGAEADLTQSPEPPWRGKDLFTLRRRRAFLEAFHQVLYSRTMDGRRGDAPIYVGPGVRPCQYKHCGDHRCRKLQEEINIEMVTEIMES